MCVQPNVSSFIVRRCLTHVYLPLFVFLGSDYSDIFLFIYKLFVLYEI